MIDDDYSCYDQLDSPIRSSVSANSSSFEWLRSQGRSSASVMGIRILPNRSHLRSWVDDGFQWNDSIGFERRNM